MSGPEQFLKEVSRHTMTIRRDDGIYRHLSFRTPPPNSWNMWFELITWPGCLTIHGDMGTWTFSRVEDMFTFFRDDKLRINKSYWAEKLQHGTHGGRDGAQVFSADLFKQQLLDRLENYDLDPGDRAEVTQALRDEVLYHDDKPFLTMAAYEFSCKLPDQKFSFDPCDLPQGKEYAYHFVWCLYAIVWGIQRYDALKEPLLVGRTEPAEAAAPTEAKP